MFFVGTTWKIHFEAHALVTQFLRYSFLRCVKALSHRGFQIHEKSLIGGPWRKFAACLLCEESVDRGSFLRADCLAESIQPFQPGVLEVCIRVLQYEIDVFIDFCASCSCR